MKREDAETRRRNSRKKQREKKQDTIRVAFCFFFSLRVSASPLSASSSSPRLAKRLT
jgi:hypothetical protein